MYVSHSFHLQNSGILQTRISQRKDPMKMNFDNFQMQKWVSYTVRAWNADEKNRFICLVFMSPSWVMVLKLSKIVFFLQFLADVSKKSKAVLAIFVYASESSCFALLENGTGYYALTQSLEDIFLWSWRISLNSCWVSNFLIFFNISWTVAQTPIKHGIFWKSMMRSFRWI